MSQVLCKAEGIVLKVIPFKDWDQIISLFTLESGLITVFYKGGRRKGKSGRGVCMPLTKVEIVYRQGNGDIFSCYELNCIDVFEPLRKHLAFLQAACDLLQVISDSQLIGKEAPKLYTLLDFFLKKIPQTANPWILGASLRLRLLKHDGLVSFPLICSECGYLLQSAAFICGSECYCENHHSLPSQSLDTIELYAIYRLALCDSYNEMCLVEMSCNLQIKIALFFESFFKASKEQ